MKEGGWFHVLKVWIEWAQWIQAKMDKTYFRQQTKRTLLMIKWTALGIKLKSRNLTWLKPVDGRSNTTLSRISCGFSKLCKYYVTFGELPSYICQRQAHLSWWFLRWNSIVKIPTETNKKPIEFFIAKAVSHLRDTCRHICMQTQINRMKWFFLPPLWAWQTQFF